MELRWTMLKKKVPTEVQLTHKFYLSTGLGAAQHRNLYARWRRGYLKQRKQEEDAKTKQVAGKRH
jgi:hypothetical protein